MSILKELSVDHPYYASNSNYFSGEAGGTWETMTEFLDDMEDADIDMNLIYRWDIRPRGETGAETGRYSAEVFIIRQRKGIYSPQVIKHINEAEAERFKALAQKHWETIKAIWAPFSNERKAESA